MSSRAPGAAAAPEGRGGLGRLLPAAPPGRGAVDWGHTNSSGAGRGREADGGAQTRALL